jgi:hypothetical protein
VQLFEQPILVVQEEKQIAALQLKLHCFADWQNRDVPC